MRIVWIGAGVLVVLGMALVPPMHVTVYDADGKEGDRLFGDATEASTYTTTHLVYRPVWWDAPEEMAAGRAVEKTRIAWIWLVGQLAGTGLLFGGLVVLWGTGAVDPGARDTPPTSSETEGGRPRGEKT